MGKQSLSDADMEAATIRHYSESPLSFIFMLDGAPFPEIFAELIQKHRKAIGDNPLMLDIGCGFGRGIDLLSSIGIKRYIGVDPAEGLLKIARERYPEYDFRVGIAHKLADVISEKCDVFIANGSLDHIPPRRLKRAMRSIRSVLRPGAYGFISWVLGEGQVVLTHEDVPAIPEGSQIYVTKWDEASLAPILKQSGFEIVRPSAVFSSESVFFTTVRAI